MPFSFDSFPNQSFMATDIYATLLRV